MTTEKRVYVILTQSIDVPNTGTIIPMSCGRNIAQACHVVSRLKLMLELDCEDEHTTIVLKVADSKELEAVRTKIVKSNVDWAEFRDTNPEVYQTETPLLTAVAAYCSRKKGKSLFYHLPGWTC